MSKGIVLLVIGFTLINSCSFIRRYDNRKKPVTKGTGNNIKSSASITKDYPSEVTIRTGDNTRAASFPRMVRITPYQRIHVGHLSRVGYYTVFLFSAKWCEPCNVIWSEVPQWVEKYSNVFVIDVDIGESSNLHGSIPQVMRDAGLTRLPAAILVSPYGLVVKIFQSKEEIDKMWHHTLAKRKHKEVVLEELFVRMPG
jgi:thiol-disulfide isomerase/thioredoxin